MSRASTLFRELKRRKVIGTCIFYVLICGGVLHVGDLVAPAIGLDGDKVSRVVLFLAIAGFPLTFILAWFYQVTPRGIARTESFVDRRVLNNIPIINDNRRDSLLGSIGKHSPEQGYDWILTVESGPLAGLSFGVAEPLVLGRSLDCDITVISPHVSRHHARLNPEGDELILEDLGSANGTLINGKRVEGRQALRHEDEMAFQDIVFRVTESHARRGREREAMKRTTFIQLGDTGDPSNVN